MLKEGFIESDVVGNLVKLKVNAGLRTEDYGKC